jgi:4-hydroxybenzoate polyprenyltransferase
VLAVAYYFSRLFTADLPFAYWIALGAAVWFIYLADHLADTHLPGNYSNKKELLALRDLRKIFTRCLLISFSLLVVTLFFLPGKILLFGIICGIFVLAYLIINQVQNHTNRLFFPRELVISVFYCLGTAGVPYLYRISEDTTAPLFILAFFLLILTNTLIFALTHYSEDSKRGVKSLAVILTYRFVYVVTLAMALLTSIFFVHLTGFTPFYAYGLLGSIMAAILLFLGIFFYKLPPLLVEVLADGILILPGILLFI